MVKLSEGALVELLVLLLPAARELLLSAAGEKPEGLTSSSTLGLAVASSSRGSAALVGGSTSASDRGTTHRADLRWNCAPWEPAVAMRRTAMSVGCTFSRAAATCARSVLTVVLLSTRTSPSAMHGRLRSMSLYG